MASDMLKYSVENGIGLILINRPDVLNALNRVLLSNLKDLIHRFRGDRKVRAVVLRGVGEKAFAAGADIKELLGQKGEVARNNMEFGQAVFSALERMGKPSIAAVNGYALGGGMELALACTLRIASRNARFGLPEAKLGLIPGYGGTQRLPKIVGISRAAQMILAAQTISAEEALSCGLVSSVVSQEELDAEAANRAAELTQYSPLAAAMALDALYGGAGVGEEGLRLEAACGSIALGSEDGQEGILAFIEKRRPRFTGM